jgi:hypothetical protein
MVIQRREMVDGVGLVLRNTTSAPGKGSSHHKGGICDLEVTTVDIWMGSAVCHALGDFMASAGFLKFDRAGQ